MSRDKRGVVNPVVGGSSPPATANFFRESAHAFPRHCGPEALGGLRRRMVIFHPEEREIPRRESRQRVASRSSVIHCPNGASLTRPGRSPKNELPASRPPPRCKRDSLRRGVSIG